MKHQVPCSLQASQPCVATAIFHPPFSLPFAYHMSMEGQFQSWCPLVSVVEMSSTFRFTSSYLFTGLHRIPLIISLPWLPLAFTLQASQLPICHPLTRCLGCHCTYSGPTANPPSRSHTLLKWPRVSYSTCCMHISGAP